MPKTQVRSFPDSSSHRATSHLSHLPQFLVSEPALTLFISDRSRLSFSQSNARCPTCGNRRGKMLHLLFSAAFQSVKNISIAFAVKLSFHWKVVKYSKSSNMNIVQYIQSFAHSCRRDFDGLSLAHQEPTNTDWCCYVNVDLVSNFWWHMKYSAIFGSIDIDPSLSTHSFKFHSFKLLTEFFLATIKREG